jgi:hypothetical protein
MCQGGNQLDGAQGIDKSRLTGKGYGEPRLVNHCRNG